MDRDRLAQGGTYMAAADGFSPPVICLLCRFVFGAISWTIGSYLVELGVMTAINNPWWLGELQSPA